MVPVLVYVHAALLPIPLHCGAPSCALGGTTSMFQNTRAQEILLEPNYNLWKADQPNIFLYTTPTPCLCVCVCVGAQASLPTWFSTCTTPMLAKRPWPRMREHLHQQEDKHPKISIPLPSGATNSLAISYSNVTIKENIFNKGCPRLYVFPPSLHQALLHQPRFWEFADESCRPQVDAWIILAAILGAVQGEGQTTRLRLARQEDGFHQAAHGLKGCRRWLSWIAWLRDCFGDLF